MISCERTQLELDAYLTRESDAKTAAEVKAHLEGCAACSAEAVFAQELAGGLRETREPSPDADALADRVLAAQAPERERVARPRTRRRPAALIPWPVWVAAAAAVLAAVSLLLRAPVPSAREGVARGEAPLGARDTETIPTDGARSEDGHESTPQPPSPWVDETPPAAGTEDTDPIDAAPDETPQDPSPPDLEPPPPEGPQDPPADPPTTDPDPRQDPAPADTRARPRPLPAVAAWVERADPKATLASGSGAEASLQGETRLNPGDTLRTRSNAVSLALAPGRGASFEGPCPSAQSLRLGPKSVLTIDSEGGLVLERGRAFLSVASPLGMHLPSGDLELSRGDVAVSVKHDGALELAVVAGEANFLGPKGRLALRAGQRLGVSRRGRLGTPRKGAKRPAWSRVEPGPVLFQESFEAWNPKTHMNPKGTVLDGVAYGERDGAALAVRFGRSEDTGGLFRQRGVVRLRVRYRVSEAGPLTVQIMNHTQRDNYHAVLEAPRPALWTEAVFRVEQFSDNARAGKVPQEGDLWGYVAIRVPQGTLEVDSVTAFRLR